jgi:hypothetical protein
MGPKGNQCSAGHRYAQLGRLGDLSQEAGAGDMTARGEHVQLTGVLSVRAPDLQVGYRPVHTLVYIAAAVHHNIRH